MKRYFINLLSGTLFFHVCHLSNTHQNFRVILNKLRENFIQILEILDSFLGEILTKFLICAEMSNYFCVNFEKFRKDRWLILQKFLLFYFFYTNFFTILIILKKCWKSFQRYKNFRNALPKSSRKFWEKIQESEFCSPCIK